MPSPRARQRQFQAVRRRLGHAGLGRTPRRVGSTSRSPATPGAPSRPVGSPPSSAGPCTRTSAPCFPTIQVPTLVLVDSDRFYEVLPDTGRFVARKIPGARVVEHSSRGRPHFHWYAPGPRRSLPSATNPSPRSARRRRRSSAIVGDRPSSPISSNFKHSTPPSSATAAGATRYYGTTPTVPGCWPRLWGDQIDTAATATSPRSTSPGPRRPLCHGDHRCPSGRSGSRCAPDCMGEDRDRVGQDRRARRRHQRSRRGPRPSVGVLVSGTHPGPHGRIRA